MKTLKANRTKLITTTLAIAFSLMFLLSYKITKVDAAGVPTPTPYGPYGPYRPHNPEDTGIAQLDLLLGASLGLYGTGATVTALATSTKKKLLSSLS